MSIYKDQINIFLQEMQAQLESYKYEFAQSIDGHLVASSTKGRKYYFRCPDSGAYTKTSLNNDPEMIRTLARKEFLKRSIDAISKNIRLLENVEMRYADEQLDALVATMSGAYRDLPSNYFLESDMGNGGIYRQSDEYCLRRHAEWAKEPYKMSTYMPEKRKFPTSAGIKVRSKSEQHIVEQLVNYGVPFRYEEVILIDGREYSFDFTFMDRYMKEFYWEHAGMMDQLIYRESHKRKMGIFESVGIVPWKNLIVTYDVDGMINIPMIKSIIENEVIPRM